MAHTSFGEEAGQQHESLKKLLAESQKDPETLPLLDEAMKDAELLVGLRGIRVSAPHRGSMSFFKLRDRLYKIGESNWQRGPAFSLAARYAGYSLVSKMHQFYAGFERDRGQGPLLMRLGVHVHELLADPHHVGHSLLWRSLGSQPSEPWESSDSLVFLRYTRDDFMGLFATQDAVGFGMELGENELHYIDLSPAFAHATLSLHGEMGPASDALPESSSEEPHAATDQPAAAVEGETPPAQEVQAAHG